MRDFRKFCRPRTVKHPKFGDVQIKLKCGEIINVAVKEYKKLVRFFKLDSVVGTSPNSPGNIIVYDSDLGQDIIISLETYDLNKTKFESYKIVGDKLNTTNGHDYVEHNGVKWATMNVGAENENQLGYLFHWGDPRICLPSDAGYNANLNYRHMKYIPNTNPGDTLKYNSTDGKTVLEPEDDIATLFWGENWRMPTAAEVISLTLMPAHSISTVASLKGGAQVLDIKDASTETHVVNITHYQGIWTWTSEKTPGYGGYNAIVGLPGSSTNSPVFNCYPVRPVFDPKTGKLPTEGDIVCYNSKLDKTSIFSFEDWLEVGDDWDLAGIYGIDTYEEENTLNGDYVIMSNGNTLIIDSSDYTKLDDNWEHVDTITDAYTAVDLGLPSGTKWASKNVGARNVVDYGGYYMYGKGSTQYVYGDTSYTGSDTTVPSSADTAYQEMGTEWNTPTKNLLDELVANTTYSWQIDFNGSGINGGKFTASNGNYIFIPASGYKLSSYLGGDGAAGYILSSTRYDSPNTYRLVFNNTGCTVGYYDINAGYSVRGVVTPPPPTPSHDYVDLGLPSGLLWCRHNVGAANPEDAGLYFAWGETTGYADAAARNTALGLTGGFDSAAYTATGGAAITDNTLTLEHDAANVNMGLDWRMPTKQECEELKANCTASREAINNILGIKYTSNINGKSIFIPFLGYIQSNEVSYKESVFTYSSIGSKDSWGTYAYSLHTDKYSRTNIDSRVRYYGTQVRAVREAPKAIDLGLPSGTLWADRNVGATAPEEDGLYFAWGETEGYKDAADRNAKLNMSHGFDSSSNVATGGAYIDSNFTNSYDAANKNYGGNWRMPNLTEMQELVDNCNISTVTVNNKSCFRIENKTDSTKYIIIPMSYYYNRNSKDGQYSCPHRGKEKGRPISFYDSMIAIVNNSSTNAFGCNIRPIQ